ncbi:hypothetical protein OSH10_06145 [Kaistia defluvii]|uniref:glycosyltransferase family 39 protein n=1 Tax=Kaistia defluvii TaxID=410841 RepID=UPI0022598FC6|nr:glycosyltransferase family 39 protein [Kaistia defluvii]MCX5518011.1 hypothetical protein [Kaistia defluvii]
MYSKNGTSIDRHAADRRSDILLFLVGFALCLMVRLSTLGDLPLWFDEVVTADSIGRTWGRMARERLSQGHFVTYFAMLKALGLAGSSDFALRLPSAILDAAAGGVVALIARRVGGWSTVVPATLLYAAFPILILYGQEARPYALQLFFVTLAMFGQIALLAGSDDPRRHATLATIGTLGAVWTIPASVVIVAIQHLSLLFLGVARRGHSERPIWIRHILVTWIGGIAAFAFLIPSIWVQANKPQGLMKWQKGASVTGRAKEILHGTYGFRVPEDIDRYWPQPFEAMLMWILFALLFAGLIVNRRSTVHRYLAGLAIGTFLVFIGISAVTAVTSRYLIGMMPAVVLLASSGAVALVSDRRSRWLAVPLIALFTVGVVLQATDTLGSQRKYDWRPIANFLHDAGVRGAVIHSNFPHAEKELKYYVDSADELTVLRLPDTGMPMETPSQSDSGLPNVWFVLTTEPETPPRLPPGAASCSWYFGKMKVVMVARDLSSLPLRLRDNLANPKVCVPSA